MSTMTASAESPNAAWARALGRTTAITKEPGRIFPHVIGELAEEFGDAPAVLSDDVQLSFRALWEQANRYTRWACDQGLEKGEAVCLLMPNCPEYLAIWLGITQAGGIAALVNTNLRGPGLRHSIDLALPRHVIVAAEMLHVLSPELSSLASHPQVWIHGGEQDGHTRIDSEITAYPGSPVGGSDAGVEISDTALYIYTSGTTGLPKAARVSHFRVMQWTHWFAGLVDAQSTDRMYNCLPMYHSVGGVVASGAVLVGGGSVVLRRKFSASEFWRDIAKWECTLFQYIGELCRYLLHAAFDPDEVRHGIRMCCGNGLRRDVWEPFAERFRIPRILEFYASTEGNLSLFNVEGKPGSIGRVPPFLRHRFPVALVKSDPDGYGPLRNARGFCVPSQGDEIGEAIARISTEPSRLVTGFEGYTREADSEEKVIRDAFEPGDAWFRTGDLMRADKQGYLYFVDRIGDTFRWKGENVATSEVSLAICDYPGVLDAEVYGVEIPGSDGRAGMAAVVADGPIDLAAFRQHLVERLPGYARPVFLRFRPQLEVTGTFKHTKTTLAAEGYHSDNSGEAVFFDHPESGGFVRFDDDLRARLRSGQIRL